MTHHHDLQIHNKIMMMIRENLVSMNKAHHPMVLTAQTRTQTQKMMTPRKGVENNHHLLTVVTMLRMRVRKTHQKTTI